MSEVGLRSSTWAGSIAIFYFSTVSLIAYAQQISVRHNNLYAWPTFGVGEL